ncbi:MAG: hypothetical protein BWK78_05375 [Thiotrichaceae bacterium IS1]|nr:MAG: hypothetical protein BWK78_05375 [Thiotrichaceae bacterium IS1]
MKFKYSVIFTALILSTVLTLWERQVSKHTGQSAHVYFEVVFLQSSANGIAQLFYDVGAGFREADSTTASVIKSSTPILYRFPLPEGDYRALRFDHINCEATVTLSNARILEVNGTVLQTISARQLVPSQQIQFSKVEGDSVQVTTVVGANDPSLNVSLVTPFSLKSDNKGSFTTPLKTGLVFLITFSICLFLFWHLPWQMNLGQKNFMPFFLTKYYLVTVLAFIVCLAVMSIYNKHPDEHSHFVAAQYYIDHWLPPAIGEPAVRNTYTMWGHSYLDTWGIEYFMAGKFAYLLKPIMEEFIATRLFNVSLFLILLIVFFHRAHHNAEELIPITLLLITPQLWYIFSYFNNDAFPLFLSLLVISEMTYKDSPLNQFLNATPALQFWKGGLLFGLLLGILLLSKQNYYTFLLFLGIWLIYKAVALETGSKLLPKVVINKNLIAKYSFIAFISFSVFTARFVLDVAINGESSLTSIFSMNILFGNSASKSKLLAYREEITMYPFRPSTAKTDLQATHYSTYLKDKGLKYGELFSKWHWHESTFKSFVGTYAHMSLFAPPFYYDLMAILLASFSFYILLCITLSKNRSLLFLMTVALLAIGGVIFISTYHSWVNAFQAQGRYLFPTTGILGLLLYQSRSYLHQWITNAFISCLFLMSVYSFLFIAIGRINL